MARNRPNESADMQVWFNLRDARDIDVYEYTFLSVVASRGAMWSAVERACADMKMSRSRFYKTRARLLERRLIKVVERPNGASSYTVNAAEIAKLVPRHQPSVPLGVRGVSAMEPAVLGGVTSEPEEHGAVSVKDLSIPVTTPEDDPEEEHQIHQEDEQQERPESHQQAIRAEPDLPGAEDLTEDQIGMLVYLATLAGPFRRPLPMGYAPSDQWGTDRWLSVSGLVSHFQRNRKYAERLLRAVDRNAGRELLMTALSGASVEELRRAWRLTSDCQEPEVPVRR